MTDEPDEISTIDDAGYRRTMEQALAKLGVGVVLMRDGKIEYASPVYLELTGFSLDEVQGVPSLHKLIDESSVDEVASRMQMREEGFDEITRYDVRARRRSGEAVDLNIVNTSLEGEGEGLNVLTLLRDVTEERALQRRSHQAQRMEAIGHLCAGIAHDFNNYLTAVRLLGEAIAGEHGPDERQTLLAELEGVTRGAARLTHQLHTFAAAEPQRTVALDINIVVFEMAEMLRRITDRKVELVLNLEPGLPPVRMNAAQLQQVVVNLVVNAGQAMPQGGRVTLRTSAADGHVTLEVVDDGHGMPPDVLERAFDPKFTTHPESNPGMGLSIVYGIARQCGGEVDVQSAEGEGTRVRLRLPRARGPIDRRRTEHVDAPSDQSKLLVVESTDEPIGALVEAGLRRAGYEVERSLLGEARDHLDRSEPDALVMGTPPPSRPDDLIEHFLRQSETGRVVFIATPPELDDALWASGRLHVVPKPFAVVDLIAAVRGEDS